MVAIENAIKYIQENLQNDITVDDIAKDIGYSKYHFCRIFKFNMNMTVMEYVNQQRLVNAVEEIKQGSKIIDVALKYGFETHSGFTKAFKREYGFCPSILKAMLLEIEQIGGNGVYLEKMKKTAKKEELYATLKEKIGEIDNHKLKECYKLACDTYQGVKRYSGDEYVTHTLNVAIILAQLEAESNVVLAGMFCDAKKKGLIGIETLFHQLPKDIGMIVKKVNEIDNLKEIDSDNILVIKLAERLHNMRTIEFMDDEKKKIKAKETLEVYLPLAKKIGDERLIDELNKLSIVNI